MVITWVVRTPTRPSEASLGRLCNMVGMWLDCDAARACQSGGECTPDNHFHSFAATPETQAACC